MAKIINFAEAIIMVSNIIEANGDLRAYMPSHYWMRVMKVFEPLSYVNELGRFNLETGDPVLEGTCKEHWSPPNWGRIIDKYLLEDGTEIVPELIPFDEWISIQTNPDANERRQNISWAIDAECISNEPFDINGSFFDPQVDMLCMGGTEKFPIFKKGFWHVRKDVFKNTYEPLN